ncbi:MAG: hypothetical protein ACTHOP_01535 [Mesorhizobium sp.]
MVVVVPAFVGYKRRPMVNRCPTAGGGGNLHWIGMAESGEQKSGQFHCPKWPKCGCPPGTVDLSCPGLLDKQGKSTAFWKIFSKLLKDGDRR